MHPAAVVSTGSLARLVGRPYWDLRGALEAAQALGNPPLELALLPEWDSSAPPVTPHQADLSGSGALGPDEVLELVVGSGCAVASVHASRDVGILLASPGRDERERGRRQLQEAAAAAAALGAGQVVIHAWDTFAASVDPDRIAACLVGGSAGGAAVRRAALSVEGIPVTDSNWSPVRLAAAVSQAVRRARGNRSRSAAQAGVTVDLNWTSMSGDLEQCFAPDPGAPAPAGAPTPGLRLLNIHVHGRLLPLGPSAAGDEGGGHGGGGHGGGGEKGEGATGEMRPAHGTLDFASAIRRLAAVFPQAQLTLELSGAFTLEQARAAMRWADRQRALGLSARRERS